MEEDTCDLDEIPVSPTKSNVSDSAKIHKCNFPGCSAAFGRPYRLEQHIRVHTGKRPFACEIEGCGKNYTRSAHLKRHMEKSHQSTFASKLKCTVPECNEMFTCELGLRRHYTRIHENRSLTCEHCGAKFRKHQHLKIHQYEHTGIKPFVCSHEGCGKTFLLPSKLKVHAKIHLGYSCDYESCGEHFLSWTLLRQHKAAAHTKAFTCVQCKRSFTKQAFLASHLATHENEREMYHCPYQDCSRQYLYEKNLSEHIKAFHEKQFRCQDENCQKVLQSYKAYKKHTSLHKTGPKPRKESGKPRATRKDKGLAKKSMTAKLTGMQLPIEMEKQLLHGI